MANYSYQNIVEIILKIAENHGSFKAVESGDIFEREKSLKSSYPLFFLHYQDNVSEENYLTYNFELYATDTVLPGKGNELQVLSNCQKWLTDIVNYLRRLDLPLIELEFGNNSSPITKGLISGGAGWVYSLSLKTPYDINSCDTPIDTIELPPIQERQIIYENVLGYQGPQGNIGFQGLRGFQGFVGNTGATGNSGNQGFQGLLGATGGYGLTYSGTSSQIAFFNSNTGLTSSQNFRTDGSTFLIFGTGSTGLYVRPNTSSSALLGFYLTSQAPSNTNHILLANGGTFLNALSSSNLQLQNNGSTILTVNPASVVVGKLMTVTDTVAGTVLDVTNSTTSAAANGLRINMSNNGFNAQQGILVLNSTTATSDTVQNFINIQKNNINATINQEHNISYSLRDNSTSRYAGKLSFAYTNVGAGTQRTRFSFFVFAGTASMVESVRIDGYNTSVGGLTASTARLHIAAGGTSSGTGALKLTAGATVSVAEDGLFEFDGSNLFFTIGGVRKTFTLT